MKTPSGAKVYQSYKKALRDAGRCKQKAEPNLLFDIGDHLAAVPIDWQMTDWNPDFMNIEEAFDYARVNADVLAKNGGIVAGVAFFPGDSDGEFKLFELTYQCPKSEGECAFLAYFQGGNLFSSSGTEETYSGDTFEEVLAEMPDVAERLNYQCFNSEQAQAGMTAEGWLCEIYPQLLAPEMIGTDRSVFKMTAISLISELGNSFQNIASSTKN